MSTMALKNSAHALIRYLEQVKQRGVFNCAHGELLIVHPQELEKFMDQVNDDLLNLGNAVKIKIIPGKPRPQ